MTAYKQYIQSVIDKSINFSNEHLSGLQFPDYLVPADMIDSSKPRIDNEIIFWKAIPANISNEQFTAFENKIGHRLPETYKEFLSYKYFIELNFGHEAEFFSHTSSWIDDYFENISEADIDETLQNGLIPFARETDRGYFCFDTNSKSSDNEYKIVVYSDEYGPDEYPSIKGQYTFIDLLKEMEERLDKWKQDKISNS
jgi:hypothetical protein